MPVTTELLHGYKAWLHYEHRMLSFEMAGHDVDRAKAMERVLMFYHPAADWHFN